MKKTIINIGDWQTIGVWLSPNFAWTCDTLDPRDCDIAVELAKQYEQTPEYIWHVPSAHLVASVGGYKTAKAVVMALEALPVDWSLDQLAELVAIYNPSIDAIREIVHPGPKLKKPKIQSEKTLKLIQKSPYWRGAVYRQRGRHVEVTLHKPGKLGPAVATVYYIELEGRQ